MNFFAIAVPYIPLLLKGAAITVEVTAAAVFFGSILGLLTSLARMSAKRWLRVPASAYIEFFRGTPLLVQIMIIYFGIPQLTHWSVNEWVAAVVSCSLNSGAYIAEIFRAGVQSIDKGQMEAARSLGMGHFQAMRFVILPQAFKRVIPPLGNEFIAMLKDTSLLSVIGTAELMRRGQLIVAVNYQSFPIYITVALMYLVMTYGISLWVGYMERKLKTSDSN
ncbi:MAG TPA: amino acid ABC transporter permease [Bacillota bacterium]|nr:amino acid ABC transporter permease [Bacillota bacterium]